MAPDSEIPVVALGSVAFCEGKFKEAIRHYRKALKHNPESHFARAYLGECDMADAMAHERTASAALAEAKAKRAGGA